MRRNKTTNKFKLGIAVLALILTAGVAGYAVSRYIDTPKQANNNETPVTPDTPPTPIACVAELPVTTKLAQKLMFAVYSDQAAAITPILAELGVGGVIIMDATSEQQITGLRDAFTIAPFIAVDQEGGTVQRYTSEGILQGASAIAQLSTEDAYKAYLKDSQYLASIGITTNFAPVVDVISRSPSPLPGRMYSSDPVVVATYAGEAIKAMKAAGIQPVIKHFPGMGSASGNTDFTSASTDPLDVLEGRDIQPYHRLVQSAPDVMIGNMIVPGLTNGQPASISPEAIALLRSIGYDKAVVYTDSLTAAAVPGTIETASIAAWAAGVDVAVIVQEKTAMANLNSYVETINSLASSLDQSSLDQSVLRILERKGINPCDLQKK